MKHFLLGLTTSLAFVGGALAQSEAPTPTPPPRTHVDSTVVGDARDDNAPVPGPGVGLDNDHHFEAGAPHLAELATFLKLSARQKIQLNDIIERGDAGAAVLIKREHDVKEMLEKTTPQDPLYAKLRAEQDAAPAHWQAGRDTIQQEIRAILTPDQQAKFEQWNAQQNARRPPD